MIHKILRSTGSAAGVSGCGDPQTSGGYPGCHPVARIEQGNQVLKLTFPPMSKGDRPGYYLLARNPPGGSPKKERLIVQWAEARFS